MWTSYITYMIRWLNTNEIVPIWVEGGATLEGFEGHLGYIPADDDDSDRPELYEMEAGTDEFERSENVVRVAIDDVPREPAEVILGTDAWWQDAAEDGETPTATP